MKRVLGVLIILSAIPILFFTQRAIVEEMNEANTIKGQLANTIELATPKIDFPIIMKDQNGEIFSEIYAEWRSPLPLADIPHFAKLLFLESEDAEFYAHRGYNISAIARAFIANSKTDSLQQGGSTITQQLIRMRYLTTNKTYERKVVELLYAAELEKQMSKDQILEAYLNEMYFGHRVYGIGAAAIYYFNRPIQQLNEAEIAFISAIPNNPSLYDPLVNFEGTKARQERLLDTMANSQIITKSEAEQFKDASIKLSLKNKKNSFPMYSDYVLAELEELIAQNEGFAKKHANANDEEAKAAIVKSIKERTAEVLNTGIVIDTALHPEKQSEDERTLSTLLQADNLQAGAVVIDNHTREIVSIFGGLNYQTTHFHRAFQAVRQPGSAIKPLLVYGPLFENYPYTAKTRVDSSPICIQSYCPKNVGGHKYGTTTIQEAFRHSHNTTAVRMLQLTGIENAFSYLKPFTFKTIYNADLRYPAALGGFQKGVTPFELADAYTSFIDGTYKRAHAIRAVKDWEGTILYEWENTPIEVWSHETVTTMRVLMNDVVLNGTGRGVPITTSYTGIKTGTTDFYHDLWAAGLNDQYTTAVWLGYDTPSSIQFASKQKRHLQAISALLEVDESQ